MKLLSIWTVLRCAGCGLEHSRVKISARGGDYRSCSKWKRAWKRKLRQAQEAGWALRFRRQHVYWASCPECLKAGMDPCAWKKCGAAGAHPNAVCLLREGHPGRHLNRYGVRWNETRGFANEVSA
jgi:hypothetical protein